MLWMRGTVSIVIIVVVLLIVLIFIRAALRIVQQYERGVIFRLGAWWEQKDE